MPPVSEILGICVAIALPIGTLYWVWRQMVRDKPDIEYGQNIGCCTHCGYDLRTGHDRCPECGFSTRGEAIHPDDDPLDLRAMEEDWPAATIDPREPLPGETKFVLHKTFNKVEAMSLMENLAAHGIWSEKECGEAVESAGNNVRWYVRIPMDDRERGVAIIAKYRRGRAIEAKLG